MKDTNADQVDANILAAKYGVLILTQARIFVEDETKAVKVFHDIIPSIAAALANPTSQKFIVSEIMHQTRLASIRLLRSDPLFDQWNLWKEEPFHFTLLSRHQTQFYKELFWYRYFRDVSVEQVAERFEISPDKVELLIKDMLKEIGKNCDKYVRRPGDER